MTSPSAAGMDHGESVPAQEIRHSVGRAMSFGVNQLEPTGSKDVMLMECGVRPPLSHLPVNLSIFLTTTHSKSGEATQVASKSHAFVLLSSSDSSVTFVKNAIIASASASTQMSDQKASPASAPVAREPGYTSRQNQILAVTVCCMILPTTVIALRLLARHLVKIPLWWDDYCAFIALVRLTRKMNGEMGRVGDGN